MIGVKILGFIAFVLLLGEATSEFNLTIVHISDFHSHWFEFNEKEGKCTDAESKAGKCFGGFPRLLSLIQDIRKKEKNVIVVSSGEFFLGRSLNPMHGWKVANALLPKLDLDAMSLSNHDFSSGIFELSAFLYGMKFPVLCANMRARETSFLHSRVNKSAVLDINGERIGIIGYLHPEALDKSRKAVSVKFYPEIPAIKEEVQRLENLGVNKIIALGHSGYHTDLDIAKTVKGVDVVIGGNSDIVLEEPVDDDELSTVGNIHGNYPRIHHHEHDNYTESELKNRTLVLHIPQHGKYVGVIRAVFDDKGRIVHESGEPVLLDKSIPQDEETLKYLKDAQLILEDVTRHAGLPVDEEVLAEAKHEFESRRCRVQECSLGNLVTDAMLQMYKDSHAAQGSREMKPVDAVIFNAGCLRYPIPEGKITIKDLVHSLFVGDFMKTVSMSGEELIKMMEQSARKYDSTGVTAPGSFLQISGLRVVYDINKPPGHRVKKLLVRCKQCTEGYERVILNKTYSVAMPEFLAKGGDGYSRFNSSDPRDDGQPEIFLIVNYLKKMKVVKPVLDGRIAFVNPLNPNGTVVSPKFRDVSYKLTDELLDRDVGMTFSPIIPLISRTEKRNLTLSNTSSPGTEESTSTSSSSSTTSKSSSRPTTMSEIHEMSSVSAATSTSEMHKTSSVSPEKLILKESNIKSTPLLRTYGDDKVISAPFVSGTEKVNSTVSASTKSETDMDNSTSLLTPPIGTKAMVENDNVSKVYHVEIEKNYLYDTLMLGKGLEMAFGQIMENQSSTQAQTKFSENTTSHLNRDHATLSVDKRNALSESIESTTGKIEKSSSSFNTRDVHDTENSHTTEFTSTHTSDELLQTKSSINVSEARASVNSSQLTTDSTAEELERVLLDALIAETIENEIIIDTDTMDILNNNLKMGLKSYLYSKDDTSTSSLHDTTNSEMTTTIKDNYHEMITNIDSKQTETEANFYTTIPENHQSDTDSSSKKSDHTSTEAEKANHHRSNRILSEESEHSKDVDSFPKNLFSQKAYNKENKYLLINSVVDSVLEKVRKEMDRKKMALSSTGENSSAGNMRKRRIVKKQLKESEEFETESSNGGEKLVSESITTIKHKSEVGTHPKIVSNEIISKNSDASTHVPDRRSTLKNHHRSTRDEKKSKAVDGEVDWIPWML